MKYNDSLAKQYGDFVGIGGDAPTPNKPVPSKQDYAAGSFTRAFAKKVNEDAIVEVDGKQAQRINTKLYQLVYVTWTIAGPRENTYTHGILVPGVYNQNVFELERVRKENGVDLKKVLTNMLEYWQGH